MASSMLSPSLLVALTATGDSLFRQAVILLVEHTKDGALGFIINKKSNVTLSELVEAPQGLTIPPDMDAWLGGPVDTASGLILKIDESAEHGFLLSSTPLELEQLVQSASCDDLPFFEVMYPKRFLVGYTGWSSSQLDNEIMRGFWAEIPLDLNLVFDTPFEKLWERCMRTLGCSEGIVAMGSSQFLH